MKKLLVILLSLMMVLSLSACGKKDEPVVTPDPEPAVTGMSHAEYIAADLDSEVTVVTYVQAHQSWWNDKLTVYCQSEDGAYFLYELACTEEDSKLFTPGTKILVNGYKSEWAGEVEIIDATYEFVNDGTTFIAEAEDVTALLDDESLIDHQNELVKFSNMTVTSAAIYKWDGSGSDGDDLYFNVADADGHEFTFTVESYLCGAGTEVYEAVKTLEVGANVNLTGFLYWYDGLNPHITSVDLLDSLK